mgnify:FL=1
MSESIVVVANLSKTFDKVNGPALNSVSMKIFPGKMTGIVGPDGAGKTTLIRLLIGLLKSDEGQVVVDGFNAQKKAERIHAITGYMPQKFGLYEDLSVIENLNLYADLRGLVGSKRIEKFEKLLHFTALKNFQSRLAGKLSGGMKQKLGLACALVGEPKLLLLDEPTVGVDPISRRELWEMVKQLISEGMGIVWSTAYLDEAEKCDDVVLITRGKSFIAVHPSICLRTSKVVPGRSKT